jgi:import inner membrane translocase subunit TIM50
MLPARAAIRRSLIKLPPLSNASPLYGQRHFGSVRPNSSTILPLRRPLISFPIYSSQFQSSRYKSTGNGRPPKPPNSAQDQEEGKPPLDKSQPEFDGPQDINANTAPPQTDPQSNAFNALPDLRQGLPSTFAEEFMKKPSSTGKNADLDITDHETESDGSRYSSGGRDNPPKAAYETSIDRRRAFMARAAFWVWLTGMAGLVTYWGRNWDNKYEEDMHPAAPNGWHPVLFGNRIIARYRDFTGYYTEPTFPKLLPIVTDLNIPPYTLVLSLEDLLVHSEWTREHGWRTAKRPGADFFLLYLSQYYELCLFTSVPSAMADPIYKKLDPYHVIMWPLYREATRYEGGDYVKVR